MSLEPTPRPLSPFPHSLPRPEQDHWLPSPSVVGSSNQTLGPERTGQRVEAAKWCQRFGGADLVMSGPGDSRGLGRGRARTALREH